MAFGGKAISQQRMEKDRLDELRREIQTLEGRDLPLWGTGLLLVLVVVAGFAALILPNLEGGFRALRADGRYLPQLLFGLMALIILFNIYYLEQRRVLRHTREDLLRQLVRSEAAERLSLVDPLTEIFNRRYLEEIVAKETSRADRQGGTLTFLMIDVDDFKMVNTRYGHLVGDRVLKEVALLLKTTFRPSDVIIRYGGDEFLVLLPGTDEQQAQRAVERLRENVDHWNKANAGLKYKMGLSCGMAAYTKGAETAEVLETADRRMYLQKPRKVATG
jgi:diguanylate cyclase (GGDEF)-like protein